MQEAQKIETNTNQNYIFPAKTGLISFRDAGYKDTSMAIAELIDNSIQAECKHIRVLAFEEVDYSGVRNIKQVKKLAVFDNGEGMSADVLAICLGFAQGTRLNKRDGIGRFGVGLPLASISQCKRTTVYSWQKGGDVLSTYLDIKEVEDTDQQYTNPVTKSFIPKDIVQSLGGLIGESGTIVVWENCDRLDLKRPETLLHRMERGFCRIYRHFLDDDDTYGKRVDIKLLSIAGTDIKETALLPNDPLYLMTPNNLPGYEKEATSIVYEKPIIRDIEYAPGKFSKIYSVSTKYCVISFTASVYHIVLFLFKKYSEKKNALYHYWRFTNLIFYRHLHCHYRCRHLHYRCRCRCRHHYCLYQHYR